MPRPAPPKKRPRLDLSPRKVPTQARSRGTYAHLVEATARVLARSGFEALTTNHVAEAAGVGIASVYEYFPNKHALVAAAVTRTVEEVFAHVEQSLEGPLDHDPVAGLARWVRAMMSAIALRRPLVRVIVQEVPFLQTLPVMQALPARLLALSARTNARIPTLALSEHAAAHAYLFPLMLSRAVTEAVIHPPPHLTPAVIEAGLVDVLCRLLKL